MTAERGYFKKVAGNGVVRITAQVPFLVSFDLFNTDNRIVHGSVIVPPSVFQGGASQGSSSNGVQFGIQPVSSLRLGPIAMLAGEIIEFNATAIRQGFSIQMFVTVAYDERDPTVAQVVMAE